MQPGLCGEGAARSDAGTTLIEVLTVVAVAAVLTSLSAPLAATVADAGRARNAAAFIASRFRLARIDAVNSGRNVAVVFDLVGSHWQVRLCRDDSGNGVRRSEIASGTDLCFDGPHEFRALFPGMEIDVDSQLVGPAGEPGNPDPVRLGASDLASFSPAGTCTSGSVFLRSTHGQQFAVRIAGVTGRLRVFRYDAGAGAWMQF